MADNLRWDAHNFLHSDAYFHPADFRMAEPSAISPDHQRPERHSALAVDVPCPQTDSLRQQVLGIIASVLEDKDPVYASARSRLRECLAHHAGSPEKALLEHLRSLHGSDLRSSDLHTPDLLSEPEEPQV